MSQPPAETPSPVRLTSLAHGGGCGCKLAPAVLRDLLASGAPAPDWPGLLVGADTADDAAVFQVSDDLAVVSTTDFFTPIVDDPFDFGRIAAANALSDVYAMGGRPIMALALLGMPLGRIEPAVVRAILDGGRATCAEAGIPVAGGHSIDAPEPIYGLAVTGTVSPARVRRNATARAGDALILGKPLGVGVVSAALKADRVSGADAAGLYDALVATTTRLNSIGTTLGGIGRVHAMTDVTGFGLLGHLLEVCRGSRLGARITFDAVPLLPGVADLARAGCRTGAAVRNWASYGSEVELDGTAEWQRDLLCDPQTSGGLLVAVAADAAEEVLASFVAAGHDGVAIVGVLEDGAPRIRVA